VEIEEMFIVSLGICQSFATGTPYAPRISQHLGEINARIECLDVSQSAADYLFCTSVAFGPQKKTLVTWQLFIDFKLIAAQSTMIDN
ncbi:hypothetical protein ACP3WW_23230, partial [Salmonella enterica]|uniref:hypothetical protein n=1 Tax=Salmonella enterica TaxID=28901 RepID=UPI003CFAFD05